MSQGRLLSWVLSKYFARLSFSVIQGTVIPAKILSLFKNPFLIHFPQCLPFNELCFNFNLFQVALIDIHHGLSDIDTQFFLC